jgi:hypothetical protein
MLKHFRKLFQPRPPIQRRRRLTVEQMEDRVVPSWGGVPPTIVPVPTGAMQVYLNGYGQGSGSADIAADEVDWYKLIAPASGSYTIRTDNSASGLDTVIGLYGAGGGRIAYNDDVTLTDVSSSVTLNLVKGATYYLGVTNYNSTPDGAYGWSICGPTFDDSYEANNTRLTAYNLGILSTTKSIDHLVEFNDDWFRFTTVSAGAPINTVSISYDHNDGDLSLGLYSSTGVLISSSAVAGADSQTVSLAGLAVGGYSVAVTGVGGAKVPAYKLTITPPPHDDAFEPNNTFATAKTLGALTTPKTVNSLVLWDSADWFKFSTATDGTNLDSVSINFKDSAGDLDLYLYDVHGNVVGQSTGTGDTETVSLARFAAGTYYVQVVGANGAVNPSYSLTIHPPPLDDMYENNDTMATARNLGTLTTLKTVNNLRLLDSADWYSFTTTSIGTVSDSVSISFLNSQGNLDLQLYNSTGTLVDQSSTTMDQEQISLSGLAAGKYYVLVFGANGDRNENYTLQIKPPVPVPADDQYEPNNSFATAFNFGALSTGKTVAGLKMADSGDWYSFTTVGIGGANDGASISFLDSQGDLDMELYDANGNLLDTSSGSGNTEAVSLTGQAAGTYVVHVYGYHGALNPNYTLTISPPSGDDPYEPNNTRTTAYNFGTLSGNLTVNNLVLADAADWYKFTTTATGTAANSVAINFTNAQGDLGLDLFDANGNEIGSSTGPNDGESISMNTLAAGTYYAQVFGENGATNPNYSLVVTPAFSTSWYTASLTDPGVRGLVQTFNTNDGTIDRSEMMQIFAEVEQDGTVSTNEYNDLKTVVNNTSVINMADPVRVLAKKVVLSDTANAHYQGAVLGNLAASNTASKLQKLVDKWFLGMDHPLAASNSVYATASGTLFGNTVSYTDVMQGEVGDCYFLSALGSVALQNSQAIRQMFIDNGDGTFTVRFFHNGVADYVTVDSKLPSRGGAFIYANMGNSISDTGNILWVALAEKAYAEENEEGWFGQPVSANSYDSISGGFPDKATNEVSGVTMSWDWIDSLSFSTIKTTFDSGAYIEFGTKSSTAANVVPGHAYVMIGYDAQAQTVTLYNPWGPDGGFYGGSFKPGQITVTMTQLKASFDAWYFS